MALIRRSVPLLALSFAIWIGFAALTQEPAAELGEPPGDLVEAPVRSADAGATAQGAGSVGNEGPAGALPQPAAPALGFPLGDPGQDAAPYGIWTVEDTSIAVTPRPLSSYSARELETLPRLRRIAIHAHVPRDMPRGHVDETVRAILVEATAEDPDLDEISVFLYAACGGSDRSTRPEAVSPPEPRASDRSCSAGDSATMPYPQERMMATAVWAPRGMRGSVTADIAMRNDRTTYQTSIRVPPAPPGRSR